MFAFSFITMCTYAKKLNFLYSIMCQLSCNKNKISFLLPYFKILFELFDYFGVVEFDFQCVAHQEK